MTQYGHLGFCITLLVGSFVPFISSWASLAHLLSLGFLGPFSNSMFSWDFTNSFWLPWSNYLILHPWGSWICHQPLTFFACITSGLLWPILTFLHHILPIGLLLFSLRAFLGPFASSRPICLFYGPMIHYSCHSGLMVFFIYLLTLFCPCCWVSSFYWASKNKHQRTFSLTPHISYSLSYLYIYIVPFIHFNYLILKCSNTLQTYDAKIVYISSIGSSS